MNEIKSLHMKTSKTKINWKDVAVIVITTALTFVVSLKTANMGLLHGGMTSLFSYNDSRFSDCYASYLHNTDREVVDPDITIVSLQDCQDRKKLARLVHVIDSLQPKVIGFDVLLSGQTDGDSALIESLSNCKNIVLARYVDDDGDLVSCPNDGCLASKARGIVNSEGRSLLDKQRYFMTGYQLSNGDYVDGFASAIVKHVDIEKYNNLIKRESAKEFINYHNSVDISVATWNEIIDSVGRCLTESYKDIQDKIVLIGLDQESFANEDVHITPINTVWSGARIHATSINTILNEDYINTASSGLAKGLSLLFLFIWIWYLNRSRRGENTYIDLVNRVLQIVIVVIVFLIGASLYSRNQYYDFSVLTIGMGVSAVCYDMVYGLYRFIDKSTSK